MLASSNALGETTIMEYNAMNQITTMTDALGGQTSLTYDGNGNVLTLTNARGKTTTWSYDNMDRVETRTDPLNRQESLDYDLDGLPTTVTDRKGQVTTIVNDALHRRTFTGFDTTGAPATYESTITTTYDAGDRATEIVDSVGGTIDRTYDLYDRLIQEATADGTVDYTYDDAGRRATMTVDGQTTVSYSYDNANRLTGVTQGTTASSIVYDSLNRRSSLTLPNGVVVEYGYDAASRLSALTYKLAGTAFGDLAYTYDALGERITVTGSYARSGLPAGLTSATYDDADQIATFGGATVSYDDSGNLTSDGTNSYAWNARNDLIAVSGGLSATFTYDAIKRRRSKTIGSTTTQFVYDGLNPVQELSGGSPTANVLTGLAIDEFFRRTDGTTTRDYLTDAFGNSLALVDGSGVVQTEYTYDPFGKANTTGAGTSNAITFASRERDAAELYYYRARFYDSRLQRFLNEDPSQFSGGLNLFAYVNNAPTHATDPLGLKPCNWVSWFRPCDDGGNPGGGPGARGGRAGASGGGGGAGAAAGAGGSGSGSGSGSGNPSDPNAKCSGQSRGPQIAFSATGIFDAGIGLGPAITVAYIPSTGETFAGFGVGASAGHNIGAGFVGGNASGVLPGWSVSGGYNTTPWTGGQTAVNGSGSLAGNAWGIPGAAGAVTYSWCFWHTILMRTLILVGAAAFSIVVAAYGLLMALRPSTFLKFHDFLNPGSRWNTSAKWRQQLGSSEYKSVGWLLCLSGLFFTVVFVRKLIGYGWYAVWASTTAHSLYLRLLPRFIHPQRRFRAVLVGWLSLAGRASASRRKRPHRSNGVGVGIDLNVDFGARKFGTSCFDAPKNETPVAPGLIGRPRSPVLSFSLKVVGTIFVVAIWWATV
jgi:RHS repeat-associated protein